jgi:hypothetical protein
LKKFKFSARYKHSLSVNAGSALRNVGTYVKLKDKKTLIEQKKCPQGIVALEKQPQRVVALHKQPQREISCCGCF